MDVHKREWSFFMVSNGSDRYRRIQIPKILLVIGIIIFVLSMAGCVRSVYFVSSYIYAKMGLYYANTENENLLVKIRFLNKMASEYNSTVEKYSLFQDLVRLKFGMAAINSDEKKAGFGGMPSNEELEEILTSSFEDPVIRNANKIEKDVRKLYIKARLEDTTYSCMVKEVVNKYQRLAERPAIWPAEGRVTSTYGSRVDPVYGIDGFHEGIDIANHRWTPVYATASGAVVDAGFRGNYGNMIVIKHPECGITTVFGHLQQIEVNRGDKISRGELIGYIGSTGKSTGPHLHYEIRKSDHHINPSPYFLPLDQVVD